MGPEFFDLFTTLWPIFDHILCCVNCACGFVFYRYRYFLFRYLLTDDCASCILQIYVILNQPFSIVTKLFLKVLIISIVCPPVIVCMLKFKSFSFVEVHQVRCFHHRASSIFNQVKLLSMNLVYFSVLRLCAYCNFFGYNRLHHTL